MESPEVKKQKLVAQLIAVAQKIIAIEGRLGKADHVIVPDKNIEAIAKKFNISIEEAQELLREYFEPKSNQ
jgi:hypothetical protein